MNQPSKKNRLWPGMVFGLLGLHFCVVGATVYAVQFRRSSFAVESDYDRKAMHWDDIARQLRHNEELGWTTRIDSTEAGQVQVSLSDRQGRPLEGAVVSIEAFHHAHARSKVVATLAPSDPGHYAAAAAIDTPGLWEFRLTVVRGPETFTKTLTITVAHPEQEHRR